MYIGICKNSKADPVPDSEAFDYAVSHATSEELAEIATLTQEEFTEWQFSGNWRKVENEQ